MEDSIKEVRSGELRWFARAIRRLRAPSSARPRTERFSSKFSAKRSNSGTSFSYRDLPRRNWFVCTCTVSFSLSAQKIKGADPSKDAGERVIIEFHRIRSPTEIETVAECSSLKAGPRDRSHTSIPRRILFQFTALLTLFRLCSSKQRTAPFGRAAKGSFRSFGYDNRPGEAALTIRSSREILSDQMEG